MTDYIKPVFDDEAFGPVRVNAPEGDYELQIVAEPFLNTSQKGNNYLSLLLSFIKPEERSKYKQVKSMIMLDGTYETKTGEIKQNTRGLASLLTGLGYNSTAAREFQAVAGDEGRAVCTIGEETLQLKGRTVLAHVADDTYNDVTKSIVKYFKKQPK